MSQSGAVEELTIQFGGLTLTLRNPVSGVTINSGQEAVPLAGPRAPATTAGPAVTHVSPWTEEWRSALCACEGTSCIFASALLLWGMVWRLRLHSRVISTFFHNLVIAWKSMRLLPTGVLFPEVLSMNSSRLMTTLVCSGWISMFLFVTSRQGMLKFLPVHIHKLVLFPILERGNVRLLQVRG